MADWPALTTFTAGQVYEIEAGGANAHPLHIHVNPYQIVDMPAASYGGGYFQIGDWHDTLMVSDVGGGGRIKIRMQVDRFTGKMVVHCHILEHEDEGMMGWISISGTEGATYPDQSTLDSTCYTSAFSGNNANMTGPNAPTDPTLDTDGAERLCGAILVHVLLIFLAIHGRPTMA